ncbi:MAG TPA: hypothetical protein VMV69_00725 [Pirellulales bacterium]|nr:hypothetical protein [Pirellulales bacterium]
MPIPVTCPGCKTSFTVGDKHAGKKGSCPKCKAIIAIPKLPATPETKSPGPTTKTTPSPSRPSAGSPAGKSVAPASGKQAESAAGKQAAVAPPGKTPTAPAGAKSATPPAGKAPPTTVPAPMPEVKIHEPEPSGPKGSTGRSVSKPIARKETKIALVPALVVTASALVTLAVAWIARVRLQEDLWLRGLGLALISTPLAAAGYTFLRDDELEPYRGRWLWFRSFVCAAVYMALWGGYLFIPSDATSEPWSWVYIGPPFFLIGAGVALATLDLDYTNGFFHYCFYVLITISLGWIAGLSMPWAAVAG